jgi:hypothetical protein
VIKSIFGILAGLIIGAAVTWTFLRHHDGGHEPEAKKEEHKEESHVLHTNDQTYVKLDKKEQEQAGLKIAPLEAATLSPEIKAFGRVMDPAPLAATLAEVASARVALDASTKELNRLKILHAQDQNVSTRVLEAAEATARRDQLLLQTAEVKMVTAWGKPIAAQADLPAFVHALATLDMALVRVDVPLGDALKAPPSKVRIASMSSPDNPVEAQFLGAASTADPQTQGQGFLLLVKNSAFTPGATVVAWLDAGGAEEKGVTVPRAAVVRHEAEAFIYLQTADELFERKKIELHHPTAKGWFIDEELKPGQNIVVVGAQQLLSEELKGQGGEE